MNTLVALPLYNEEESLPAVLDALGTDYDLLAVDDGSTDRTPALLAARKNLTVLRHARNEGYGAALRDALRHARDHGYSVLVTMDVDGQHEPQRIPELLASLPGVDVVSASRYLQTFPGDSAPPPDRRAINEEFTALVRRRLGLPITDAFCGFKAYGRRALEVLEITEPGYGMPLEVWVQIAHHGLRVREAAIPRIYFPDRRAFGGPLHDPETRRQYYRVVWQRAIARWPIPVQT